MTSFENGFFLAGFAWLKSLFRKILLVNLCEGNIIFFLSLCAAPKWSVWSHVSRILSSHLMAVWRPLPKLFSNMHAKYFFSSLSYPGAVSCVQRNLFSVGKKKKTVLLINADSQGLERHYFSCDRSVTEPAISHLFFSHRKSSRPWEQKKTHWVRFGKRLRTLLFCI